MKLILASLLLFSSFSFANDCHQVIRNDLSVLANQSFSQRQITFTDYQWIVQKLEMAASEAKGNGYSCVSYESRTQLNYSLVIILKSDKEISKGALRFLNNLKYNKKFQN
jgi:hypothetical protein